MYSSNLLKKIFKHVTKGLKAFSLIKHSLPFFTFRSIILKHIVFTTTSIQNVTEKF